MTNVNQLANTATIYPSNIFVPRVNIKPYEYPQLLSFVDAIRHSYWLHTEYNYNPDIQDMKVNMTSEEANTVKRTMLAISQIESAVKSFWSKIHDHIPKPEVAKVGTTFSESEVRHEDAYSELIERLGLNSEFENIQTIPAMQDRIAYISKINKRAKESEDPREYFKSIIFFSVLIENVSLFSQFFILMSLNKHKNVLKGISNAVEATSKEEDIHAQFGFALINIIKAENPDWWTKDLQDYIVQKCVKAFKAEQKVLDWIYQDGDIDVVPRQVTENYIKHRLNQSLEAIGIDGVFNVDVKAKEQFKWFDDEITVTKTNDFFQKRSTNYTKRDKVISGEDLF